MEDAVFSVELESLGYAVLQFRANCRMDVFCVLKNTDDDWRGLDLNKADILFTIVVADHRLLKLVSRNITSEVIKNSRPRRLMGLTLSISNTKRKGHLLGLDLIAYDPVFNPNNVRVLVQNLDPVIHRDILYSYEDIGMHGEPEQIRRRISRYFSEGINWDTQKEVLYPELEPPPPGYKPVEYKPDREQ